jgi:hypothetical protein
VASVSDIKRLRVFLSSPGDVQEARLVVRDVVEKFLQKERVFRNAKLEVVSWDDPQRPLALDAYLTPQQAIDRHLPMPSECDVFVMILRSRMGTPLVHEGKQYLSGTHYEFENAIAAEKRPRIFVYRWTAPPEQALADFKIGKTPEQQRTQLASLDQFLSRFRNADGTAAGSLMTFATIPEFGSMLLRHVGDALQEKLEHWRTGQGDLGIALSFRRKLTEFREEYLISERGRVPFGGRDAELDQLDRWLFSEARPSRLLLTAPAGRGKSALVVQWLEQLRGYAATGRSDWRIAFIPISIRVGSNRPEEFYQGLALRLSEISDLALDETKQRDADYFKASVRKQLEHIAEKSHKVLVVLDGIDEALESTFDAAVIPKQLPPTLRVLISARWQLRDNDSKGWLKRLGWDRDTRAETIELEKLDTRRIADVLIRLGAPMDIVAHEPGLVERLATLTEGEPLLVRFYCADLWDRSLEGARITAADLDTLKPGFGSYFERWLEHQEQLWNQEGAAVDGDKVDRVLLILAYALGRLPEADLLALMKEVHGDTSLAFADRLLRPLRRFVMGDGKPDTGFVLSHPKIGDYLRSERFHSAEKPVLRAFADWGRKHLAALNAGEINPDDASHYLLLYLPRHLEAARAPASDFMAMVENGWRLAWEAFDGGTRGFSETVKRAWAACDDPGVHLGAQWRCALVMSSVNSLGENIPGSLLLALLIDGNLSPQQVRHYAELKGPTEEAVETLASAAIALNDNALAGADLAQASIFLALKEPDNSKRENLLMKAITKLSGPGDVNQRKANLLDAVLITTKTINNEADRSIALAALAPYLDPAQRADAIAVATALGDELSRARALGVIALCIDPAQRHTVLSAALTAAKIIKNDRSKCWVLAVLVPHLDPTQKSAALEEFLAAAISLKDDNDRTPILTVLAPYLNPAQLSEALAATATIGDWHRADALVALAPGLDRTQLNGALAAATAITHEGNRCKALALLARYLDSTQFEEALSAAREIKDQGRRGWVLAMLSPQLRPTQSPSALDETLAAFKVIFDENREVVRETTGLGLMLPPAVALEVLAPNLNASQLSELLAAIMLTDGVRQKEDRISALGALAPHLNSAQLRDALTAATALGREEFRSSMLVALAPHLAHSEREAALASAMKIDDPRYRFEALMGMAPHVEPIRRGSVLKDALKAATDIFFDREISQALVALIPHLSPMQRREAVAAAIAIKDEGGRAAALVAYAPHLDPDQCGEVLHAATAIRDADKRSLVLAALAPHLDSTQRLSALAAARWIGDDEKRSLALIALAHRLDPDQREAGLAEARAAVMAIGDPWSRDKALLALGPYLSPVDGLVVTMAIKDESSRSVALAEIVPRLDPAQRAEVLTAVSGIGHGLYRSRAVAALAPYLDPSKKRVVLADVAAAAAKLVGGKFRSTAVAALIPHLEPAQKQAVLADTLRAAMEASERDRSEGLAALAPYLNRPQRAAAAASSKAITWDRDRSQALKALAPYLDRRQRADAFAVVMEIDKDFFPMAFREIIHDVGLPTEIREKPHRAEALAAIALYLDRDQRDDALVAANGYSNLVVRCEAVAALAPHLEPAQRATVLANALSAATQSQSRLTRYEAIAALAPHLDTERQKAVLGDTMVAATADGFAPAVTAAIAPHLTPSNRAGGIVPTARLLDFVAALKRPDALTLVASTASLALRLGGPSAVSSLRRAINDVCNWYP